jgi:4-alpha-glucanotransferase
MVALCAFRPQFGEGAGMSAASELATLRATAKALGIQPSFVDVWGKRRHADPDTLRAAVELLGGWTGGGAAGGRDAAGCVEPILLTAGSGRRVPAPGAGQAELLLDGGDRLDLAVAAGGASVRLPGDLPVGRHRLRLDRAGDVAERWVLVAPERTHDPSTAPDLAVFLPLHGLASSSGHDLGDLGDLGRLAAELAPLAGRPLGLAVLPLLATSPERPSPYSPLSRRFWNELHLDLTRVPGGAAALADPDLLGRIEARRQARLVDWTAVAADVHRVLDAVADAVGPELDSQTAGDDLLAAYARFRGRGDQRAERRHRLGQWLMRQQLDELAAELAGRGQALVLDLPLGATGDGFDVASQPEAFVAGWSVGAPPDEFFPAGQIWGFPPPHPVTTRGDGHRLFAESVANRARYAGVVRIDHVMALQRLWWVPVGAPAGAGVYVHYPADELVAALAIESHRHRAVIVGEDLGTVPPAIGRHMRRRGLLGMYEEQFAIPGAGRGELPDIPRDVVAGMNTHDMPTFAAFWSGDDIDDRVDLGLLDATDAERARRQRAAARSAYRARLGVAGDDPSAVLHAALARLGRSDARVVSVGLEDLWLERAPQNVPGTDAERPNWRRRMAVAAEDIAADGRVRAGLALVGAARAAGAAGREERKAAS